jgi:uncharacterized membrane protein YccC
MSVRARFDRLFHRLRPFFVTFAGVIAAFAAYYACSKASPGWGLLAAGMVLVLWLWITDPLKPA